MQTEHGADSSSSRRQTQILLHGSDAARSLQVGDLFVGAEPEARRRGYHTTNELRLFVGGYLAGWSMGEGMATCFSRHIWDADDDYGAAWAADRMAAAVAERER